MPLYNWIKLDEEKDIKYVCKNTNLYVKCSKVTKSYVNLQNQFFKRYLSKTKYIDYLKDLQRLSVSKCDAYSSEDRSKQTIFTAKQRSFNEKWKQTGEKTNMYELVSLVEQQIGFQINLHTTTVGSFYNHLNVINKKYGK